MASGGFKFLQFPSSDTEFLRPASIPTNSLALLESSNLRILPHFHINFKKHTQLTAPACLRTRLCDLRYSMAHQGQSIYSLTRYWEYLVSAEAENQHTCTALSGRSYQPRHRTRCNNLIGFKISPSSIWLVVQPREEVLQD